MKGRQKPGVGIMDPGSAPNLSFPFFCFGAGSERLAVMGGGLILDSGEAENTFLCRCQDRYLVYSHLLGLRSMLFVSDEKHAQRYDILIGETEKELFLINKYCKVF